MRGPVAPLLVWILLQGVPGRAGPLLQGRVGGPVFTGPTSPHVSSFYWNPAAAGLSRGLHVFLAGSLNLDQYGIDRAPISSSDGEPAADGDRTFSSLSQATTALGWFGGASWDLGTDRVTVGAANFTLGSEELPHGPEIAYHSDGGSLLFVATAVSGSLRVSSDIYFGLTITFHSPRVRLRFARDAALAACTAAPCPVEDPASAEAWAVDSSFRLVTALSVTGGGLMKLRGWWLGGTFISPPFTVGRNDVAQSGTASVTLADGTAISGPARLIYSLPLSIHLAARRPVLPGYDLVLAVHYARLSSHRMWDLRLTGASLRAAGLPEWLPRYRGFHDQLGGELGLENGPGATVRLGVRAGVESGAVRRGLVAADQVDGPKLVGLAGAEVRLARAVGLGLGYAVSAPLPRSVDESAFRPSDQIACNASGYDSEVCRAAAEGRAIPTAAGDYRRLSHEMTVTLSIDRW